MRVALVNTNRIRPPIAPIGLEYVAEALQAAGHEPVVLDLCWEEDWRAAVAGFFSGSEFGLVGVTLRNTDDCAFTSRHSFLPEFAEMVEAIKGQARGPVIVGGVGFSAMPEVVLSQCQADGGIWGEGEWACVELANRVAEGREWRDTPNLVWRAAGEFRRNPPGRGELSELPPMSRRWVDNRRYFAEGGQLGFETTRGCDRGCVYCADPVAKGRQVRRRPPGAVAEELERLLAQGVDHLHTCDSEFNVCATQAAAVCEETIRRGLGEKLRWYAYCTPTPFSEELAQLMGRAGCVGINFGVDSGDTEMLGRLGRGFGPQDIAKASRHARDAGMAVMLDLLLGSPGETRASLARTIEVMKRAEADRVGVAVGVRVYPGTELAARVGRGELREGLSGGDDPEEAAFLVEPRVADGIFEVLDGLIGDDPRFLFFDPNRAERNYNYNANEVLVEAIRRGYRGAYWDILRRVAES